ncbi:MAG: hypothetical protein O9340_02785 [Cyclobacteriaceae bacterium]|nr:hypothetical protein [Cyclobacteriaceae bacterium]
MKTQFSRLSFLATLSLLFVAGFAYAQPAIQYFRHYDQRGINVFETTKNDTVAYEGFKFRIGAGFTQGYQNLSHSNKAKAILADGNVTYIEKTPGSNTFVNRATGADITGTFGKDPNRYGAYIYTPTAGAAKSLNNSNAVYELDNGFPLAQANLNFDVQLADGVRLNLVSYMSSHHHNEFWVKGGFFQIDKVSFLNSAFFDKLWKNLTLKVGHMEINYGDAHYRRSDGGHALQNPFMENNIMDEFTTEIGGELYWQKSGFIAMLGMTDGEIQGNVTKPNDRKPSLYGKFGFDKQINDDLRVRLTGSFYRTKSSVSNTLFGGDRTGSNYQYVMEPTTATLTGNSFSGRFNPGFRDNLTTFMINPFVKFGGFELFGTFEQAKGNTSVENGEIQYSVAQTDTNGDPVVFRKLDDRKANQTAVDVLYRFGKYENFYVGAKYNTVDATIVSGQASNAAGTFAGNGINQGVRTDVKIDRTAFAAGWFITKNVLFKAEYVIQNYKDYPEDHIMHKGKFDGWLVQGIIGF